MSSENQSPLSDVRIAYHADGSATVNDVPVVVEPGQNVRDAAYQAAVGFVVAAGANGPVAATSVEADGTQYPVTLYPLKTVSSANALFHAAVYSGSPNGAGAIAGIDAAGAGASAEVGSEINGVAGGFQGRYRRARRAWYRPTFSMSWLVAAACACVMMSVLATVLLQENGPSVVRLSVDTENDPGHSTEPRAIGREMASLPASTSKPETKATASKHPAASTTPTHAKALAHTSAVGATARAAGGRDGSSGSASAGSQSDGSSQPSNTAPQPTSDPKPRSAPGNHEPVQVTGLTVALFGADKTDMGIAYLITVNTSNAGPITLSYTYTGSRSRATVRRSMALSGATTYAVANLIPAQPYCGGTVTMTASTSPVANIRTATATTQSGC